MKRLLILLILCAPTALGHAEPAEASPGWNERLDEAPTEAWIRFTEPVHADGSWIRVQDLQGNRVDNDDLQLTPGTNPVMRVTLPPLPDGGYLVRWQTYSQSDGHTIGGAIGFSIGGFAPPESQEYDEAARAGGAIGRALSYLGYTFVVGVLAFQLMVLRQPVSTALDRPFLVGAAVHAVGVLVLLLDTAASTGLGLGGFLAGGGGRALAIRFLVGLTLLALTALWCHGPVRPRMRYHVLAFGWLVAIALGARLGHAPGAASWVIQILHAVAIAAWVGALGFLVQWLMRHRDADVLDMGRRFGTLGIAATVLMAITGLYLGAVILGPGLLDGGAAFSGGWRTLLSLKILLASAMIGLAAVNRYVILGERAGRLREALAPDRRRGLVRLAGTEAALGVVIILLAGGLMSLAAPSEGLEQESSYLERSAAGFDFNGNLRIAPEPVEGELHTLRLYLEDPNGEPLLANTCSEGRTDCVTLLWYPDAEGAVSGQAAVAVPEGDGWWVVENALFTAAGPTTVEVEASSAYAYQDELAFRFRVLRSAQ